MEVQSLRTQKIAFKSGVAQATPAALSPAAMDHSPKQHHFQYSLQPSFSVTRTSANPGTWKLPVSSHALSAYDGPCCIREELSFTGTTCVVKIVLEPHTLLNV